VFSARAHYSSRGRIGFYSVESKASFDSLVVSALASSPAVSADGTAAPRLVSFWFSDFFTPKSTWWHAHTSAGDTPSPWYFGDNGCAQVHTDNVNRSMELTRYLLGDFSLNLLVSLGDGTADASFAVGCRKSGDEAATVRFSKKDGTLVLESTRGGGKRTLKKRALPSDIFGNTSRLVLTLRGNSLLLENANGALLSYSGKHLPDSPGRLAFSTQGVRAVLHQINVSSPATGQ
jgi:hypothetical protein